MVTFLVLLHVLAAIVSAAARARLSGKWRAAATANTVLAAAAAAGGAIYVALSIAAVWTALTTATPDQRLAALWIALAGRLGGIAALLAAGVVTAAAACVLYVRSRS